MTAELDCCSKDDGTEASGRGSASGSGATADRRRRADAVLIAKTARLIIAPACCFDWWWVHSDSTDVGSSKVSVLRVPGVTSSQMGMTTDRLFQHHLRRQQDLTENGGRNHHVKDEGPTETTTVEMRSPYKNQISPKDWLTEQEVHETAKGDKWGRRCKC